MDFGIRVGAVVERDGSLLLARHEKPGRAPYWVLPGGRLEPGEKIPECATRELLEETGLDGTFAGILYVSEFLREGRHTVDITAQVEVDPDAEPELGGDPEVGPDSEPTLKELRWVEFGELGEIELLPAWLRNRLVEDPGNGRLAGDVYLEGSDA